ncbi:hypothetical protein GCM10027425_26100 [Alteromonas gracilis]
MGVGGAQDWPMVLSEAAWRAACRAADASPGAMVPLEPDGEGGEECEALPEHVACARLVDGQGAGVVIEVAGVVEERGTLGRIGVDDRVAAGAARVLVVEADRTAAAAEVALDVVPADSVMDAVLAHVPELRFVAPSDGDRGPWTLSADHAQLIASAAASGERALERLEVGLGATPEVLREVACASRGSLSVDVVTADGPEPVSLRWLLTAHGWVALGLAGGAVVHALHDRADVRAAIAAALT